LQNRPSSGKQNGAHNRLCYFHPETFASDVVRPEVLAGVNSTRFQQASQQQCLAMSTTMPIAAKIAFNSDYVAKTMFHLTPLKITLGYSQT
jgi:hypothetical protein